MLGYLALSLLVLSSAELIEPKVIVLENGEMYSLQSVSLKEEHYVESVLGCGIKCTNACLKFASGNKALNCVHHCGCQELLIPVDNLNALSDLNIEVNYPKAEGDSLDFRISSGENEVDIKFTGDSREENFFSEKTVQGTVDAKVNGEDVDSTKHEYVVDGYNYEGKGFSHTEVEMGPDDESPRDVRASKDSYEFKDGALHRVSVEDKQGDYFDGDYEYHVTSEEGSVGVDEHLDASTNDFNMHSDSHADIVPDENGGSFTQTTEGGWSYAMQAEPITLESCEMDCLELCSGMKGDKENCISNCGNMFCAVSEPESTGWGSWVFWGLLIAGVFYVVKMRTSKRSKRGLLGDYSSEASYLRI